MKKSFHNFKRLVSATLLITTVSMVSFGGLAEVVYAEEVAPAAGAAVGGIASCAATEIGVLMGATAAGAGTVSALIVPNAIPGLLVVDPGARASLLVIAGTSATKTSNSVWQVTKDSFLNCIFYTISRMALQSMTASIIAWANNGFNGNPSFIQDPKAFFTDVVDQSVGQVLNSSGYTSWMCTPFALQLKRALIYNRSFMQRSQCTLTGVVKNFDNFVSGVNNQFGQHGGWNAWNVMTTQPQNNPYGADAIFNAEVNAVISGNVSTQLNLLNWGKGFLSFQDQNCVSSANGVRQAIDDWDNTGGEGEKPTGNSDPANCKISTPGSIIADQVNKSLGVAQDELISAKQINEVVGALIAGLVTKVFSSGGLFGLGSGNSNSYFGGSVGQSYVSQLASADTIAFSNNKQSVLDQMRKNLSIENRYVASKNFSIARIESSASTTKTIIDCYQNKISGPNSISLTSEQTTSAKAEITSASSTLNSILAIESPIKRDVAIGEANIASLNQITDTLINTSLGNRDQFNQAMTSYADLSVRLQYEGDIINAEYERNYTVPNALVPIDTAVQNKINECKVFPSDSNN